MSIEFTSPIWVRPMYDFRNGEAIAGKIAAILFGILGVLVIVRPRQNVVRTPASLITLTGAMFFGISVVMGENR